MIRTHLIISLVIFLLSCSTISTELVIDDEKTIDTTSGGIVFEGQNYYTYRIYLDSLLKTDLILADGTYPPNCIISSSLSDKNPLIYNFDDIPNIAWIERRNYGALNDNEKYETCKLVAETLYCPSDTNFMPWDFIIDYNI